MDYAAIVEGCKRHNARAQRALYDEMAPMAMGICMRYAGGRDDAQDMLQEGLVKVFERIGRVDQPEHLRAWVARTVAHACIDILRQRRWEKVCDEMPVEEAQIDLDPFGMEAVVAALQQLPAQQRAAFNLCEVEGYSRREAAQTLKCSESNIRSQLCRAKTSLRKLLENEYQHR